MVGTERQALGNPLVGVNYVRHAMVMELVERARYLFNSLKKNIYLASITCQTLILIHAWDVPGNRAPYGVDIPTVAS